MAIRKKKKVETVKVDPVKENPNKGKILFLEYGEIENPVLGKVYNYKDMKVRVVHRGNKLKVEVE